MAYYLQWSGDSGSESTNNNLLQLSGITGSLVSIEYTVKNTSLGYSVPRYIFDIRRSVGSTSSGGDVGYILQFSSTKFNTDGTSGFTKNGVSFTNEYFLFNDYAPDDIFKFNVDTTPSGGAVAFGARFNEVEHNYGFAVSEIIITDGNGAHTIDMSDSNGTGSSLTSTDGAITATLFNFPTDDSQWVFYDAGGAVTGTGSPQAQRATASGTGERTITGSGSPQATRATATGTGERVISGSGTPQAATATTSGTGTTAGNITGSGAVTAQRATATGVGLRVITGTGLPSAQAATTTGTGSVSGAVSGAGSANAQPATVSGTGTRIVTGSGTAQAPGATVSGTGEVAGAVSGSGSPQAQRATATGVGLRVITGQGTGQAQRASASGTGSVQGAITGTGTAQAQRSTATGVGLRVITGSGSVQAQRATAEGSDRGFLSRPVVKPGSIDIQPKYGTTDIQPKYGTTDIQPKYGTTDY